MKKHQVISLLSFFEKNTVGPVQGSEPWLAIRTASKDKARGFIGGSDMASLIGQNPFRKLNDLMKLKQGIEKSTLPSEIYCWFGILFEEIAVKVFEDQYNTTITNKDISLIEYKIKDTIFSPDGICPLPVNANGDIILNGDDEVVGYVPVLVEIKCPLKRDITRTGRIPRYYSAQLQTGLHTMDFLHSAIFIDNMIRISSISDMDIEGKCNSIHDVHFEPTAGELYKGYILFDNMVNNAKKVIDYGNGSYDSLLSLLTQIRKNKFNIRYLNVNEDYKDHLTPKTFGILGWKLFENSITIVNRDDVTINKILFCMNRYSKGYYDIKK